MRILAFAAALAVLTAREAWAGITPPIQVPEPATLSMLALMIGGVGLLKFRQKRK